MRKSLIFIMLISALVFTGCEKNIGFDELIPDITVTLDGQNIVYIKSMNQWNDAITNKIDPFVYYMTNNKDSIQKFSFGGEIVVEFKENPPKTVEVQDMFINENGERKFTDETISVISVGIIDGKISFDYNEHFASYLDSNTADIDYRGFLVKCVWENNNSCDYAFVIQQ